MERRRAHISELTLNEIFRSSCICFQFSTSDIRYYVLLRLEAWALSIPMETTKCLGLWSPCLEAGFAG